MYSAERRACNPRLPPSPRPKSPDEAAQSLTPSTLAPFLLNVAPTAPVFIWGPPGVGKSALVRDFAASVGLPCVSLLGSQLEPEDIIGVPQIVNGRSRFCPPTLIARDEPYCLFLDELNACSQEVQKAFYSLILDRRVGEFQLLAGSIVIGAGNRAEDAAITRPLSSALINRLIHVQWAYVMAQAQLYHVFSHADPRRPDLARSVACALVAADFLKALGFGERPPEAALVEEEGLGADLKRIEATLREQGELLERLAPLNLNGIDGHKV